MKNILKYTLFSLLSIAIFACEKDDLCIEGDPRTQAVVLEFYDKVKTDSLVVPPGLIAKINGYDNVSITASGSTLSLPLLIDSNTTTWNLILNGNDDNEGNEITDQITFNYEVVQEYVSRACGYKANFILDPTNGVTTTNNWIDSFSVINSNIVNPDEIHIKIYF